MTLWGMKDEFAIGVTPLNGPPEEADPCAAVTWVSLEFWVGGHNLCENSHPMSGDVHAGVNWPAIYLVRWLVRSWNSLFYGQAWPIAGHFKNARDVAEVLDNQLVELEVMEDAEKESRFLELRDEFVQSHCLSLGGAGAILPPIFVGRYEDSISIAWASLADPSDVLFCSAPGDAKVSEPLFMDVVMKLVDWCRTLIAEIEHPIAEQDRREFDSWKSSVVGLIDDCI